MIKGTLFWKKWFCDRCGKELADCGIRDYYICNSCYVVNPVTIRKYQVKSNDEAPYGRCHLCSVYLNPDTPQSHHVCSDCVSKHPDNEHDYHWQSYIAGGRGCPDTTKTWASHCNSCGGVLGERVNLDNTPSFSYYRIGNKSPMNECFPCAGPSGSERIDKEKACTHDWQMVSDCTCDPEKAAEECRQMRVNPASSVLGMDDVDILFISYGWKTHWCWKCGLFYKICPAKPYALPVHGLVCAR